MMLVLALLGAVPVPRYHGPPGRLPKRAGRPMGPATLQCQFLRDFVGFVSAFLFGFLGWMLGILCGFFCRWGWNHVVRVGAL